MTDQIKQSIYQILENTDQQIMDLIQNLTDDQMEELKGEYPTTSSTNQFDAVHLFQSRNNKVSVCVLTY